MPGPETTVSRGPSGVTVFLVFLALAALCLGAGFTLGHYILSTLNDKISDSGGAQPGGESGGGGPGDTGGTGGAGGTGGGTPAGGGAGSVTLASNPLTVYAIQVGAFNSRANADRVVADLAGKGYPGYVLEPVSGSGLYKVRTVTATRKEVAQAAQGRLKTQGFADCFVTSESLDETPLKLEGSSVDYLNRIKTALEAVASGLRIEGDIWDKYHSGTLDRTDATKNVDALITTIAGAKDGLASLAAPQDLASLGQAADGQLAAAKANLASLQSYLSGQVEADRLSAESSFIGLLDGYGRLGVSLRSRP